MKPPVKTFYFRTFTEAKQLDIKESHQTLKLYLFIAYLSLPFYT